MKEESGEGRVEELGKGREVGGNLNWLHLSGDLGFEFSSWGISRRAFSVFSLPLGESFNLNVSCRVQIYRTWVSWLRLALESQ